MKIAKVIRNQNREYLAGPLAILPLLNHGQKFDISRYLIQTHVSGSGKAIFQKLVGSIDTQHPNPFKNSLESFRAHFSEKKFSQKICCHYIRQPSATNLCCMQHDAHSFQPSFARSTSHIHILNFAVARTANVKLEI